MSPRPDRRPDAGPEAERDAPGRDAMPDSGAAEEERRERPPSPGADPREDIEAAAAVLTEPLDEDEDEEIERRAAGMLRDPRRIASLLLAFIGVVVAVYVLFPKLVGLEDTLARVGDAKWYWVVVALGFNVLAFAAYVALFRGVLTGTGNDPKMERRLDFRASYQITMAGLAATRVFSAAGAGGVVLTYWALRRAGMPRRRSACRMVAFLALLYTVYLGALVVFGVLLRTGALPGDAPVGGTIVPAAIAGAVLLVIALISLIPEDFERRLASLARGYRRTRMARRAASGPATVASGVRTALGYLRHPRRGALAVVGAVSFWGANIGILWASFEAFGGDVAFGVLVQGFFVGMAANLIPSPAGGVGSVDAGMIGAFVLFGVPAASVVFPAVLTYRVIAFWLPIPPGVIAFFQLQKTIHEWQAEDRRYAIQSKVTAEAT